MPMENWNRLGPFKISSRKQMNTMTQLTFWNELMQQRQSLKKLNEMRNYLKKNSIRSSKLLITCRNICKTSDVEKNSFFAFMVFALSNNVPSKCTGNSKYASWFQDRSWVGWPLIQKWHIQQTVGIIFWTYMRLYWE